MQILLLQKNHFVQTEIQKIVKKKNKKSTKIYLKNWI